MAKKQTQDNKVPGAGSQDPVDDQNVVDDAAFVAAAASDIDSAQQIGELTEHLQRLQAEFDNYRRRSVAQQASVLELAKQDVVLQLLPFIDNIERALLHVPEDLAENPWAKGVAAIAKQSQDTLAGLGVTRIEAVGQPFDHNTMEAIAADGEGDNEIVAEELQAGYKIGDKVIRHAMVKVSRT